MGGGKKSEEVKVGPNLRQIHSLSMLVENFLLACGEKVEKREPIETGLNLCMLPLEHVGREAL